MKFEDIDINLIPSIYKGFQEEFIQSPNIIGSSSIPFGMRRNVIKKREGLSLDPLWKLLVGKIVHWGLQKEEVLKLITKQINKELGLEEREINGFRFIKNQKGWERFKVIPEKAKYIEILPNKYFRMHSDIHTTKYTIEIKTTSLPRKFWGPKLAPYHLMQLNTYMGFNHHKFGFLLRADLKAFTSQSTRFSYVWNNYFMLYPIQFNQELFDYTLNRIKQFFEYSNEDNLEKIPCPEFPQFECKGKCRKYCPNPIDKVKIDHTEVCSHCGKPIREGTMALIRNDRVYHYTNEKGHEWEDCVEACKQAWRRE